MADERDPHDVVRLITAPNPALAHIWEQALRDEGIHCKVVGDFLDAGIGDVPGASAELWVHRDDVERATAVLRRGPATGAEPTGEAEA
jgi:hypothetical protein